MFGQESAFAMHLALWYVLLVCHQYDVCENAVGSVYVTRGSGVLSSTGDLVRGVGGVCDMCMCLAQGGVGGEGMSG